MKQQWRLIIKYIQRSLEMTWWLSMTGTTPPMWLVTIQSMGAMSAQPSQGLLCMTIRPLDIPISWSTIKQPAWRTCASTWCAQCSIESTESGSIRLPSSYMRVRPPRPMPSKRMTHWIQVSPCSSQSTSRASQVFCPEAISGGIWKPGLNSDHDDIQRTGKGLLWCRLCWLRGNNSWLPRGWCQLQDNCHGAKTNQCCFTQLHWHQGN